MKSKLTELVFILDMSGSMATLTDDTIGGFNSLLAKQQQEEGETLVSTVLFNDRSTVLHDRASLHGVTPITRREYCPCGCTALLDALGDAIHHIGNVHKYARKEDVPAHTLFVITTDGMENASHRYSAGKVRQMIRRQKEKYGWEFLFLGANIDAVETAADYGIDADHAVQFHNDARGVELNYRVLSEAVSCARMCGGIQLDCLDEIRADFAGRKG
ncbi:MAG: VWA domain-containing protein [Clostridia bacterium]|nr:VWA domain-containing protein [Clostridia bacterium]